MNPPQRAALYNTAFPDRPPLASTPEWVTGTWCIGACYKNPNRLYGAYPHGYLERVHSMFPDARHVLHVFSGGLTVPEAMYAAARGVRRTMPNSPEGHEWTSVPVFDLVDAKTEADGRYPTFQGSAERLPFEWAGRFDLVLADPPYSAADAEVYGHPMPNIGRVMQELHRVTKAGGNLVWLDQKWPMHRKDQWRTWGHVGLVRSTNHRMRLVSMFERQP